MQLVGSQAEVPNIVCVVTLLLNMAHGPEAIDEIWVHKELAKSWPQRPIELDPYFNKIPQMMCMCNKEAPYYIVY